MGFPAAMMQIRKCHRRWWTQESSSHLEMGPVGIQAQLHHTAASAWDGYPSSLSRETRT